MRRFLLAGFVILLAYTGNAQKMLYSTTTTEALLEQKNKLWYIKVLTDSMSLNNGVVVYGDGRIVTPNGVAYTMAGGDCIKFNGQMAVFYTWISIINGVKTKRHIMRVWTVVTKPITLQNGTVAMPDGHLKLTTGNVVRMLNKDFMGFEATDGTAPVVAGEAATQ